MNKERRKRWLAAGLCKDCGGERGVGLRGRVIQRCPVCADKHRVRTEKYRGRYDEKYREMKEVWAEAYRERERRKKEAGLCRCVPGRDLVKRVHKVVCEVCGGFWYPSREERARIGRARTNVLTRERGLRLKRQVYEGYGGECSCCGETESAFLTIDHVENDGNKLRRERGKLESGVELYRRLIKEGFPAGYQVLCRNCNWGKHANGGVCPHKKA